MPTADLPKTMRALELRSRHGDRPMPVLAERPVPTPRAGEVLVQLAAAPINPNDLLFLRDQYEVKKPLPVVLGFEAGGTVVGSGGGLFARGMVGRRVACAAGDGDGTWSEYFTVPALQCAPLSAKTQLEQGATLLTNPLTACVMVAQARREGRRAVVLTAAAGALGQMLCRLCKREGVQPIAVVRRPAQVATLRALGVEQVLDSSAEGFDAALRTVCAQLGATLALDAVAGETTRRIMAAMPSGSTVRVYGMLSSAPCEADSHDLVFRGARLEGFTMYEWVKSTPMIFQFLTVMKAQRLLGGVLATPIRARMKLTDFAEALRLAYDGATDGKILLVP